MTTAETSELDNLFAHELKSVNDDIRRKAALSAFYKLRLNNQITVEQFLNSLERHKEMWEVVGSLGILDFAEALTGHRAQSETAPKRQRTRISDEQKNSLKEAILRVLEGKMGGLNRLEVTATLVANGLSPAGISRTELPEKLRQPLHELLAEGKLHTVGEKRLLKYVFGEKKPK